MLDDLFDDAVLRNAFGSALGLEPRSFGRPPHLPQWSFERRRLGLRDIEVCPLGLYTAVRSDPASFDALRTFVEASSRSALVRVRVNVNPLEPRADELAQAAAACGYGIAAHETHLLPIGTSIDEVRRGYHTTKRAQAQRTPRTTSTIVIAREAAQLDEYFSVYKASLARWGRPGFIHPRRLFDALLNSPSVRVWLNYVEGRLACAMVVFHCRRYALYWQGVSRIDEDQKRAHPMVRLMDSVLQHLVDSGVPYLNLGASDGLPNVRRFKEEFGARAVAYPTLVYASPLWRALVRLRRLQQG